MYVLCQLDETRNRRRIFRLWMCVPVCIRASFRPSSASAQELSYLCVTKMRASEWAREVEMYWQDVRGCTGSMWLCNSQLIHILRQDTAGCKGKWSSYRVWIHNTLLFWISMGKGWQSTISILLYCCKLHSWKSRTELLTMNWII